LRKKKGRKIYGGISRIFFGARGQVIALVLI
jgi:hypothetical protein